MPANSRLTALIVDDEFHARENLGMLLEEFCPSIEVIGKAESINEAEQKIIQLKPQVIFLDIRMPSGSEGFELLARFAEKNFQVVFVTAFKDYAIQAFHANAIHYLLKPVDISELQLAVQKLEEYNQSFVEDGTNLKHYMESMEQLVKSIHDKTRPRKLTLYHSKGFKIVDQDDIVRLEADGNCTILFFRNGTKYLDTKTLKTFEELLNESKFMRVHKSHIINLECVQEYLSHEGDLILQQDQMRIPVSRTRLNDFLHRIKSHS